MLPEPIDRVSVEYAVATRQGQTLLKSLRGEHSVERIAVMPRERVHPSEMRGLDRQQLRVKRRELIEDDFPEGLLKLKFA